MRETDIIDEKMEGTWSESDDNIVYALRRGVIGYTNVQSRIVSIGTRRKKRDKQLEKVCKQTKGNREYRNWPVSLASSSQFKKLASCIPLFFRRFFFLEQKHSRARARVEIFVQLCSNHQQLFHRFPQFFFRSPPLWPMFQVRGSFYFSPSLSLYPYPRHKLVIFFIRLQF